MPMDYWENQRYLTSVNEMTISGSLGKAPPFHFLFLSVSLWDPIATQAICVEEVKISTLLPKPDLKHSIPVQVKFFYSRSHVERTT